MSDFVRLQPSFWPSKSEGSEMSNKSNFVKFSTCMAVVLLVDHHLLLPLVATVATTRLLVLLYYWNETTTSSNNSGSNIQQFCSVQRITMKKEEKELKKMLEELTRI